MTPYTEIFASNIPLDHFDEITRSFWDHHLLKVGGKFALNGDGDPRVPFKVKFDAYRDTEFPCGLEISFDTALKDAHTIVAVSGKHKNLACAFLTNLKQRDNGPTKERVKRFWSFPTPVVNVAITQLSAAHTFRELAGLYVGRLTPQEFQEVFARTKKHMAGRQSAHVEKWLARSQDPDASETFNRWYSLHHVTTADLEEFNGLIGKVLSNDVL
jgi:hypothetical protein